MLLEVDFQFPQTVVLLIHCGFFQKCRRESGTAELDEVAAIAAEKKRLKNKAKRDKAKAKKLAQAGGPTAEAKKLLDEGDAAGAFALLAPRQHDPSPPKLLYRCALRWREQCVNAVALELSKGDARGNLQVSSLPDALAWYLRRSGEECVWRLPKRIHPLLAAPLYCRFAFHEGAFDVDTVPPDDIKCSEDIIATAKEDMEALQRPNCAGVLVPTGRIPQSALSTILKDGLEDWAAYWRLRATAVPRLPQLRRERGGNASLLPAASNHRLSTNHLTLPLTILWAAREHGIDIASFVGKSKEPLVVHVVGAEEETEARNAVRVRAVPFIYSSTHQLIKSFTQCTFAINGCALPFISGSLFCAAFVVEWCIATCAQEVLREIALLIPDLQVVVTLLGPGMKDHPSGWITHEGLTVNGRKGCYHDLLPQPLLKEDEEVQRTAPTAEPIACEADVEPQANDTRKQKSKKKNKPKTVILASAGVAAHENLLEPPVRNVCRALTYFFRASCEFDNQIFVCTMCVCSHAASCVADQRRSVRIWLVVPISRRTHGTQNSNDDHDSEPP